MEQDTSRRDAIKLGLAALAGMGVSALAPTAAYATTGNMQFGAANNADTAATQLSSSAISWTLRVYNTGTGSGIVATNTQPGNNSPAVEAYSAGTGSSARAITADLGSASAAGWAIHGQTGGSNGGGAIWGEITGGSGCAVKGSTAGGGKCMEAEISNATNQAAAVVAHTNGGGYAIDAYTYGTSSALKAKVVSTSNSSPAILALTNGNGYPLHAEGGKAQLYLSPAAASGPPTTNAHQLGELYMDALGTLYTCSAAGTPGTWRASNSVPKTISQASADHVLMLEQQSTGYAFVAKGANAARIEGTLSMNRSGRAKIAKGKKTKTVTVPGGLKTTANIICTMQHSGGKGVYIRYAKRTSSTKFTITLSKAASATCYVAWMVLG